MVEAVALGDRVRELLGGDRASLPAARARAARRPSAPPRSRSATRSRSVKPSSTSTSVRNRPDPPRRRGAVTPFAGLRARRRLPGAVRSPSAGATARRWEPVGHLPPRADARIASTGAGRPVKRSKLSAPWPTSSSSPSTTGIDRARAACTSWVSRSLYTKSTTHPNLRSSSAPSGNCLNVSPKRPCRSTCN